MNPFNQILLLSLILFLPGCMDADPFGLSRKTLSGPYELEQFESGDYYLLGPHPIAGGGILDGVVEEIGWSDTVIAAKRHANYRGDPDAWMIVHVQKRTIEGPIDEQTFRQRFPEMKTEQPEAVWKRL